MSLLQQLLPQKLITRFTNKLSNCHNARLKNFLIKQFIKAYKVDLSEAKINDTSQFPTFNAFFTRELKAGVRPICEATNSIISPADGYLGQIGHMVNSTLIQAKGRNYSLEQLLANKEQSLHFTDGTFATIYLAPHNYHRVHMPITGTLEQMTYIPGKLFSVNPKTCATIDKIFARNERVVTIFKTEIGRVAIILVGAIVVGGMSTTWHGPITPPHGNKVINWDYQTSSEKHVRLNKGDEMGLFNVGSTVVLLFEKNKINFVEKLKSEQPLTMGKVLAHKLS